VCLTQFFIIDSSTKNEAWSTGKTTIRSEQIN
jgi:hypothetical protein